jgi:hypothetical protein
MSNDLLQSLKIYIHACQNIYNKIHRDTIVVQILVDTHETDISPDPLLANSCSADMGLKLR